ncbi:peptidase [Pseudoalteromonas luteoviolacea]|uniref:Peptidase n=1 Tax=Pseudoalteromonas luteoviolacea TaxID=43657 RepID=A0A1C0TT20_9GAMM|nr:M14 family metallocarboxypeptidase [Pseudoalteromonas luteoviolacea]MBQ4810960.1 M14 family metallocarboxypeptidase [Pseudoalteromonas luteoviolacea]OCQ22472.1 peptidase [Pseudoalteromonas luteoviolacea]
MSNQYSIGTLGTPWCADEKQAWYQQQQIQRSYQENVISRVEELHGVCEVEEYGVLAYEAGTYRLFALKNKHFNPQHPTILVTGGVHGYETSGVMGALKFAEHYLEQYSSQYNFIILPCISPWGFETINRWNPEAIDPNRSFYANSPANESRLAMEYIAAYEGDIIAHIDLHETTDTDNSEFRPALAARDGKVNHNWNIPDGFYLVGHTQKPEPEFQKRIIDEVKKVTHIADADENGQLIGVDLEQFGVINYDGTKLGLCMGMTDAPFVTTTEVYPDSQNTTSEECNDGQVASILGVIAFLSNRN